MLHDDNTYSEQHTVLSFMIDGKLRLTPTLLFGLMQDVAVNHVDRMGCGWDYLHGHGQFWALSRMDVEIIRRPRWHEPITITTWGKKHNYLVQPRDFQITTEDGELLVRATANWVILDTEGQPQMLDIHEPLLHNNHERHAIEKPASRLRTAVPLPADALFQPVVYSYIDMNRHANNSSYVTWAVDSFDNEFHRTHELEFLSINYLQQTHADDHFAIAKVETAPNDFLCSIYAQNDNLEVCRVRTKWRNEEARNDE